MGVGLQEMLILRELAWRGKEILISGDFFCLRGNDLNDFGQDFRLKDFFYPVICLALHEL